MASIRSVKILNRMHEDGRRGRAEIIPWLKHHGWRADVLGQRRKGDIVVKALGDWRSLSQGTADMYSQRPMTSRPYPD
jgi:hypothetical protein